MRVDSVGEIEAAVSARPAVSPPAAAQEDALEAVAELGRHHVVQDRVDGRVDVEHHSEISNTRMYRTVAVSI